MAVKEEEEEVVEYESDPEDALLPTMRRREASDDEEGEGEGEGEGSDGRGKSGRGDLRDGVGSEGESDGQGGAEVYDDEEEYYDDEDDDLGEELEEELEGGGGGGGGGGAVAAAEAVMGGEGNHAAVAGNESPRDSGKSPLPEVDGQNSFGKSEEKQGKDQEEEDTKKESEPYAVPTAGAFYMHDDRFQENGRGRHRRMFGGRKLWDPKDERAWVHDRFEEMNLQDTRNREERRKSRGRFRGRGGSGRGRGAERGYNRGNRSQAYHEDGDNQTRVPRTVRGRGPRRYEPVQKNRRDIPAVQRKQSPLRSQEPSSNDHSGRRSSQVANVQSDPALPRKSTFASSLNSASPPFYPSGSSNQDMSLSQKRDVQTGIPNKASPYSTQMDNNLVTSQANSFLRGKTTSDMVGHDRLYMDDSLRSAGGKNVANSNFQPSSSLSSKEVIQSSGSRVQGRGISSVGPLNCHSESATGVGRVATQFKPTVIDQRPVQFPSQPAMRISPQQVIQQPSNGNQASSPPHAPSLNSSEVGQPESPPGSSKSKIAPPGKARVSNQGAGRGFLYGGAQVIGASGAISLAHGDQNFPGTPALLPVMQLGGQHTGGIGVPAMGMALPGYVAQPQLGFGNSEMTWVPVLAGGAGALGASYCPPYIALDGNYYPRPSGQTSSSTSSRETTSTSKPSGSVKTSPRSEVVNEDFGQRQNKPRRYSEMNFGQ